MVNLTVDTSGFNTALKQLALRSHAELDVTFRRAASSFVRRLIGITPPASGTRGAGGILTHADELAGRAAIDRDLAGIFTPVKLKHKRPEQWPDPAAIHQRLFLGKRPGQPLRSDQGRAFYHVDQSKLSILRRELWARIGSLASGWLAAALALKSTGIPAWVKRQGIARGQFDLQLEPGKPMSLTVVHSTVPAIVQLELNRRVVVALQYETNAMLREVQYLAEHWGQDWDKAA